MVDNSIQKRLERSRRHRSWANAKQISVNTGGDATNGTDDNDSVNRIGNPSSAGISNIIMQSEERIRHQKLQGKIAGSHFSTPYGMNSRTTDSHANEDEHPPVISSASSQDSNQTSNSVASRRQRIMALSAKNKAQRVPSNNSNTVTSPKVHVNFGMSPSTTDRASPPPPPPPPLPDTHNNPTSPAGDVGQVKNFKIRSDHEQRGREHNNDSQVETPERHQQRDTKMYQYGGRIAAYRSPSPTRKGSIDSPSTSQLQTKGNRVVVPRSPTASIGSVGSNFSTQQPKLQSGVYSRKSPSKQNWMTNVNSAVNGSPEVRSRSFSSPKYGSHSTGNKISIESQGTMYKNLLKPIQKDTTEVKKSHEKEAYGAIIETPQKSSVSSLHAMFDTRNAVPLMPMNSTNSSVRHSLPLPSPSTSSSIKTGGVTSRYRMNVGRNTIRPSSDEHSGSFEAAGLSSNDDRSVSSNRSSPGANRPQQKVFSSWGQKQQLENNEKKEMNQQHRRIGKNQPIAHNWMNNVRNTVVTSLEDDQDIQSKSLKSTPALKEDKSRVQQYYNSSWRMQSPVQIHENETSNFSSESRGKIEKCADAPDPPIRSTGSKDKTVENSSGKSVEHPSFAVTSFMYSQKNKPEVGQKSHGSNMDLPCDSQKIHNANTSQEIDGKDTATDVIKNSLTTVTPSRIESDVNKDDNKTSAEGKLQEEPVQDSALEVMEASASMNEKSMPATKLTQSASRTKPWENDTMRSVLQTWQTRSSKAKDASASKPSVIVLSEESPSNEIEGEAILSNSTDLPPEDRTIENTIGEIAIETKIELEIIARTSSSDSFIEEKKSDDLSFDEDNILGQDIDGILSPKKASSVDSSQHGDHANPRKFPLYDDDSYLSRGDTDPRALGASESFKTISGRSRTSATCNSEDMSIYVEDQRIISKKEEKILSAQFEQMNLEVAVGESASKIEDTNNKQATAPATLSTNLTPTAGKSLPRLNPSPKDCDAYRNKFFEDSTDQSAKSARCLQRRKQEENPSGPEDTRKTSSLSVSRKNGDSLQTKKSKENHIFDIWASATTSHEERDEAIKFDETEEWLDRDPDLKDSVVADDVSTNSEQENANEKKSKGTQKPDRESRPILIQKPPQSIRTAEKEKFRTKAMGIAKKSSRGGKQDVFDPFGIDSEESGGLTVEISDDLFSSNPDPFMTEESFSPLEWSTPNGSNAIGSSNKSNANFQHIGYYNSPDSRVEI